MLSRPRILRPSYLLTILGLALSCTAALRAQQDPPPSLGDVARKLREEKQTKQTPSKAVITNDDLAAGRMLGSANSGAPGDPRKSPADPTAALDRSEALIRKVQTLDKATLFNLALQGSDWNFPGRHEWEARLLQARQVYVTHGLELLRQLREGWEAAKALDASEPGLPASDPRVQALLNKMKLLAQEGVRTDAAFQTVVLEGRDLARQPVRP